MERVTNELSSVGQGWGYVGGTSALILGLTAVVVSAAVGASTEWLLGMDARSPVRGGGFCRVAFKMMPDTLVAASTGGLSLLHGWRNTASVLHGVDDGSSERVLPHHAFFSDGYSTMTTVSLLFASRDTCMGLLSLMILSVLVPLFAGVGNFVWLRAQRKAQWTTKQTLVINLLAPVRSCSGVATGSSRAQLDCSRSRAVRARDSLWLFTRLDTSVRSSAVHRAHSRRARAICSPCLRLSTRDRLG